MLQTAHGCCIGNIGPWFALVYDNFVKICALFLPMNCLLSMD